MNNKVTMEQKNNRIPELRFPEFLNNGEWEEKELNKFGFFFRGLTYSAEDTSNEGLLVLRSGNIQNERLDFTKDLVFVNKSCKEEQLLRNKDIVICMSNGSKLLVGKNAEYKDEYSGLLTVGAFCSIFRPKNDFAKFLLRTKNYEQYIALKIGGGNINNLRNSDLEIFKSYVPNTPEEQQKIADCLSSLDELITAHTDKLEILKNHKKGLLQNLFPQEGQKVPNYRFPEFVNDGEWEEKKIGEVFLSYSGGTPTTSEKNYYDGEIPFIRSAEINKEKTELFISELGLKSSSAKLVNKGDLLVALYGANSGDVGISKIDGAINQAILCLKSEYSNIFVYHFLSLKKDWITSKYIQGGQGNLSGDIIKSIELYFPKKEEQQKIADCLMAVDNLITAQTEKIEQLKNHKKGLMQGLFPKIKE